MGAFIRSLFDDMSQVTSFPPRDWGTQNRI